MTLSDRQPASWKPPASSSSLPYLFSLIKREDLRNRLVRLAGVDQLQLVTQAMDDASKRLSRYLLLQFAVNGVYGGLFGLAVFFIGIPHPSSMGVCAFLLRFIPYLGTPVSALFPMVLAFAIFPGLVYANC